MTFARLGVSPHLGCLWVVLFDFADFSKLLYGMIAFASLMAAGAVLGFGDL